MTANNICTAMIAYDLEDNPVGFEFYNWPLHITITFYFRYNAEIESNVITRVTEIYKNIGKINVRSGQSEMYGRDKKVAVTEIINEDGKLALLNKQLVGSLSEIGCKFIDLTYMLDNYSPHVSDQGDKKCLNGYFAIDALSLIKKIDDNNKIILKTIEF